MRITRIALTASLVLGMAVLGHSATASAVTPDLSGQYFPVTPARILDTRDDGQQAFGPGATQSLQVGGHGGVPSTGAAAVVLNVTIASSTAFSLLTVYPDNGTVRPTVSNLNFPAGSLTGQNSVTVKLGPTGGIKLYNDLGTTNLVVDVMGYYADSSATGPTGSAFQAITPFRTLDTRLPNLGGGFNEPARPLAPGETLSIPVDIGIEDPTVTALAVNITAVAPQSYGVLTAWSGAGTKPTTSTLDFLPNTVVPNMAIVPARACPTCPELTSLSITNDSPGSTNVIVDVFGFYDSNVTNTDGMLFHPVDPVRIADTRPDAGIATCLPDFLDEGDTENCVLPAPYNADAGLGAVVLNVTAVDPSSATVLSVWPGGGTLPIVSNLNPFPGTVVPNAVITGVGGNKDFNVSNDLGDLDVVIDLNGYFEKI